MSELAREADVKIIMDALPNRYWDRANQVEEIAPQGIACSNCGEAMAAEDDHGRFICFNCGHRTAF